MQVTDYLVISNFTDNSVNRNFTYFRWSSKVNTKINSMDLRIISISVISLLLRGKQPSGTLRWLQQALSRGHQCLFSWNGYYKIIWKRMWFLIMWSGVYNSCSRNNYGQIKCYASNLLDLQLFVMGGLTLYTDNWSSLFVINKNRVITFKLLPFKLLIFTEPSLGFVPVIKCYICLQ